MTTMGAFKYTCAALMLVALQGARIAVWCDDNNFNVLVVNRDVTTMGLLAGGKLMDLEEQYWSGAAA